MSRHFNYPIKLTKQEEGGYLVEFPNLPEAITQGETIDDVLQAAADCFEEAIANRIILKLNIPKASTPKKNQRFVSLHATIASKVGFILRAVTV